MSIRFTKDFIEGVVLSYFWAVSQRSTLPAKILAWSCEATKKASQKENRLFIAFLLTQRSSRFKTIGCVFRLRNH